MIDVKPTRSELLELKKKIALAKSGYKLLKRKRDGLIMEFFRLFNQSKKMIEEIESVYKHAKKKLILAETTEGATKLRSIAMLVPDFSEIKLTQKKLMGIHTYQIELEEKQESDIKKLIGVNIRVEEAVEAYRKLIIKFIKYSEVIYSLYRILDEIEKTKRKVNALEFRIISNLEEKLKFVAQRLEEMERENIFRLKRMKSKEKRNET